jgi:hypothetical protein
MRTARDTRAWVHRKRLGWPGTEPAGASHFVQRFGSQPIAIGVLVLVGTHVPVAMGLAAVALVLGLPGAWVRANDRLSTLPWIVAVVLLLAAAIAYAVGGHGARAGFGAHGQAGTAAALTGICAVIQLVGYLRRWGTQGNLGVRTLGLRRDDPAAIENELERMQRGRGL